MSAECDEWRANPSVNPYTNRYIKKGGKLYHKLEAECGTPHSNRKINLDCFEWHGDPSINPRTFRRIKAGGPAYRKLEKKCGSPSPHRRSPSPHRRSPSPRRKSPRRKSPRRKSPRRRSPSPRRAPAFAGGIDCLEWHGNPNINPKTYRRIKTNGPAYRKLEKRCGSPTKVNR